MTRNIEIDLSTGFHFFASIKINRQKQKGRKILFGWHWENTSQELLIGLDKKDNLNAWFTNKLGETFELNYIPKRSLEGSLRLSCEVGICDQKQELRVKLSIKSDTAGDTVETIVHTGNIINGLVKQSIGNREGKENAAFELGQILIYSRILTPNERLKIINNIWLLTHLHQQ